MDYSNSSSRSKRSSLASNFGSERLSGQSTTAAGSNIKRPMPSRRECVTCIVQFLEYKGYGPISAKDLMRSPPLQVVINIWNFLFRLVDENVTVTKENMAIEVPKFFREFGYPQLMKTSHLRTPTADHQWDANLVALAWLCKLLVYEQEQFGKLPSHQKNATSVCTWFGSRGKAAIRNGRIAKVLTDLTSKHFQLYTEGHENGRQLSQQFEESLQSLREKLQTSADSAKSKCDALRARVMELQEHLDQYESAKSRIETLQNEVLRIDKVTLQLSESCLESETKLSQLQENLENEKRNLEKLKGLNEQLAREIEAMAPTRHDVKELMETICSLKAALADNERKTKEFERLEPEAKAKSASLGSNLTKLSNGITVLHESIKTYMSTNGMDFEHWNKFEPLVINPDGTSPKEVLGVDPQVYKRRLNELIGKDTNAAKLVSEEKQGLLESNEQMSSICNSLIKEACAISQEMADLVNDVTNHTDVESRIIAEASERAQIITTGAKEELGRNIRDLNETNSRIQEARQRLVRQREHATVMYLQFINQIGQMLKEFESSRRHNCAAIQNLIS